MKCKWCKKPIVFGPYFFDRKDPIPPVWFHPPGAITCSLPKPPAHWTGKGWPVATPDDEEGPDAD